MREFYVTPGFTICRKLAITNGDRSAPVVAQSEVCTDIILNQNKEFGKHSSGTH